MSPDEPSASLEPSSQNADSVRTELIGAVTRLAQQARRVYRCRAFLQWLTLSTVALVVLVSADVLFRWDELGMRWLSSLLCVAAVTAVAVWLVRPAWRFAPTNLDIARGIEQAQPDLREKLSTVVEIAEIPSYDRRFGSSAFREAHLAQWQADQSSIDWKSLLDTAPAWRAALVFMAVVVGVLAIAASRPAEMRLALKRLLAPWSALDWPRADQLRILGPPDIVVVGSQLLVEVVDSNPPLPAKVDLHIRRAAAENGGDQVTESIPMRVLNSVAVASIASIREPLEIRAVGGDDLHMAWHRVAVASPPELRDYRFQIKPPEYLREAPRELVGNRIEVIEGTQVGFSGAFDQSIQRVEVVSRSNGNPAQETDQDMAEVVNPWNVALDASGKRMELLGPSSEPWVADRSTLWQLRITTMDDLEILDPNVWEVLVKRDAAPVVSFGSLGSTAVSPQAGLRIKGQAIDDLGLRDVRLVWEVGSAAATNSGEVRLWTSTLTDSTDRQTTPTSVKSLDIDAEFPLAEKVSASIGQRLSLWLEAHDHLGQIGRSQPQVLEVKATEDVLAAVEANQTKLLEQLRELVQFQRRNAQMAARTEAIVNQTQSVRREDADSLSSIAQLQHSIRQGLSGGATGAQSVVASMLEQLRRNGLEDSSDGQELARLMGEIQRVSAQPLAEALESSRKASDAARAASNGSQPLVATVVEAAKQSTTKLEGALTELEALVKSLSNSESVRQLHRDLAQVLNRQQEIRRGTDQLDVSQAAGGGDPEQSADRAGLRADQQALARTVDELLARSTKLSESVPEEQAEMRQAAQAARQSLIQSQVSQSMRDAADLLNRERFAEASATQQQIVDDLRRGLRQLGSSPSHSLEDSLAQTNEQARSLSEVASDQAALADKLRSAGQNKSQAQGMADQQASIRDRTSNIAQNMEQDGEGKPSLSSAVKDQTQAHEQARAGDARSAAKSAKQAADKLKTAAGEMTGRAEQLAQELAKQELLRLDAALDVLARQQQPIVAEIGELANSPKGNPARQPPTEEAAAKVRQLASRQEAVRQMVRDVGERARELPAFDWMLKEVQRDMQRTVAALQRQKLRPEAELAAGDALKKLRLAADALQSKPAGGERRNPSASQREQKDGSGTESQPNSPPVANLKLLRGLQADINDQTKALHQREAVDDPEQHAARLQQLSQQQRVLGTKIQEILQKLAQRPGPGSEGNP